MYIFQQIPYYYYISSFCYILQHIIVSFNKTETNTTFYSIDYQKSHILKANEDWHIYAEKGDDAKGLWYFSTFW